MSESLRRTLIGVGIAIGATLIVTLFALDVPQWLILELVVGILLVVLLLAVIVHFPAAVARRDSVGVTPPSDVVKARNDVRTALLQGFASVLLVIGAIVAFSQLRSSQVEVGISAEGQQTDRFSQAVGQLASQSAVQVEVRLGGIFTLEQLAAEVPSDRPVVSALFAEYIQSHAQAKSGTDASSDVSLPLQLTRPDVEECLSYLASHPGPGLGPQRLYLDQVSLAGAVIVGRHGAQLEGASLVGVNLSSAVLTSAKMEGANLANAKLANANVVGADLSGAELGSADFRSANLTATDLAGTDLALADLQGANLQGADLSGSELVGANLSDASHINGQLAAADFRDADVSAADFRHAKSFSEADFTGARCDGRTLLPSGPWRCARGLMQYLS